MPKKILVIYTGGTIGMMHGAHGLLPHTGYLEQQLQRVRQFFGDDMPMFDMLAYDKLLDSANVTPNDWNRIASDIADRYDAYDGFVVLHGTDTMAYSTSALSFILENLAKPVIFTGAQIPLSNIRSDGWKNITDALYAAGNFSCNEVVLCFGSLLLRGNRAKKVSTERYEAFASPNFPALATIESEIRVNNLRCLLPKPVEPLVVHPVKAEKFASLVLFPGISIDYVKHALQSDLDALVIASFGTGNAPTQNRPLMELFREAGQRDILLINTTQCQHGYVNMETYETACQLRDIGFIGTQDMTSEAVIAKLYHLFSFGIDKARIKSRLLEDLRGEIS